MRKKNFVIKIFDSTTNFWLSFLCSRREKVLIERKSEEHTYANFCLITFEAFKEGWKWFFFKDENQILATVHLDVSWLGCQHQSFQGSSFICSSTTATFLTGGIKPLLICCLIISLSLIMEWFVIIACMWWPLEQVWKGCLQSGDSFAEG